MTPVSVLPAGIMDLALVFQKLAISLGLGLIVGLQRQKVQSQLAGIRTFALITVLGSVAALLGQVFGGWMVAAGLIGVALLMVAGNLIRPRARAGDAGLTTEVAALLMYGVGAYLVVGHAAAAVAMGGAVAVLLHLKAPMHQFVARIGESELKAVMQLVLLGLVILPVLPNQAYGPYGVFNPYEIWLMVVLIVGISLGGYLASRFFGPQAGTILAGILGGLISSTATTVSYSRRTQQAPDTAGLAAIVILVASTTAFVRVLAEIAAVARQFFWQMALPLCAMLVGSAIVTFLAWLMVRQRGATLTGQGSPAELKTALIFGATYALVLFLVAAARDYFGTRGLYAVAVLSGLQDLDAITLSTARMVQQQQVPANTGWRLVLAAALSNLVFKGGLALVLGHGALRKWILVLFGILLAMGAVILFLWP